MEKMMEIPSKIESNNLQMLSEASRVILQSSQTPSQKSKNTRKSKLHKPRWWNQTYLLYLVLRTAEKPLSRRELIPKALELDKKIAKQRNLPVLFGGKTPQNTASRIFTDNKDKLFEMVLIPGSKSQHFKLSFEPGNFDKAVEEYNIWMKKLIELDWPILFDPHRKSEPLDIKIAHFKHHAPSAQLSEVIKSPVDTRISENNSIVTITGNDYNKKRKLCDDNIIKDECVMENRFNNIPKSLAEVVEVKESLIKGAGRGLFAVRDIPKFTYLGFYFGVPLTEDEFDSLKLNVGVASQYAHRYRNIILDATDEFGQPFINHPKIFCPFHFMNEHSNIKKANIAFVEGYIVNAVVIMTTQNIKKGQELLGNYGKDVDRDHWK